MLLLLQYSVAFTIQRCFYNTALLLQYSFAFTIQRDDTGYGNTIAEMLQEHLSDV